MGKFGEIKHGQALPNFERAVVLLGLDCGLVDAFRAKLNLYPHGCFVSFLSRSAVELA